MTKPHVIPWTSQEGPLADYEHYAQSREGHVFPVSTRTEWQTGQIATSGFYIRSKDHTQATEVDPADKSELSDEDREAEMRMSAKALRILRDELWRTA